MRRHHQCIIRPACHCLQSILALIKNRLLSEERVEPDVNVRQALMLIRVLLLLSTSLFYLAGPPAAPLYIKTAVVSSMIIATLLLQSMYDSDEMKNRLAAILLEPHREQAHYSLLSGRVPLNLMALIIIETLGIALLILPTGGVDSPFVWLALNPVIAAAVYLPFIFCWVVLALFLGAAIAASAIYPGLPASLIAFAYERTSMLLVFFFSISMVQVAVALFRKLADTYTRLAAAHRATEKSLRHISSLYQALEAFSTQEEEAQLAQLLAGYTEKLCGCPGICWIKVGASSQTLELGSGGVLGFTGKLPAAVLEEQILRIWQGADTRKAVHVYPCSRLGGTLLCTPVEYQGEWFGMLACLQQPEQDGNTRDRRNSLLFLAQLGGITLGRLQTDRLWGRLLVNEEQNRIANEIHDGVAQYLFSITCALHTLSLQDSHLQENIVQERLQLMTDTANRASRELRAAIYQLSPSRRGENVFVDNLALYLDELGRLNNIKVDLQAEGSEDNLSPALRKALYRIIREACSNALRHGHCTALQVQLHMHPGSTELLIKDDGCGYASENDKPGQAGLGTTNMRQMAEQLGGRLITESALGQGTRVCCLIPG